MPIDKEYVSLLIGLYKDNGSVPCVGINFLLIRSLYLLRTQLQHTPHDPHIPWPLLDSELNRIYLWAIMNR